MKKVSKVSAYILLCVISGIGMNSCSALGQLAKDLSTISTESGGGTGTNVTTPGSRMEVKVTKMELIENGKKYMIEFLLTNRGEDIEQYGLSLRSGDGSMVVDNTGTEAVIEYIQFGGKNGYSLPAWNNLPNDTPIKVKVVISGFSSKATGFSRIQIHGGCWNVKCLGAGGDYIFKNVVLR